MTHWIREISKIKRIVAFWNLNIRFPRVFHLLSDKQKQKKTSNLEICDARGDGTSGEDLQISGQSVNWNARYPVNHLEKYVFEKNAFEVFITCCTTVVHRTLNTNNIAIFANSSESFHRNIFETIDFNKT